MGREPWEQLAGIKSIIITSYLYREPKLKDMQPEECVKWLRDLQFKTQKEANELREQAYNDREALRKAGKAAAIAEAIKDYLNDD